MPTIHSEVVRSVPSLVGWALYGQVVVPMRLPDAGRHIGTDRRCRKRCRAAIPASLVCRLLWRELEDHAAAGSIETGAGRVGGAIVTAVEGSAVQTTLLVHHQRPVSRFKPVSSGSEIPERGLISRGIQLVHCSAVGAIQADSAGAGGAVEIALAIPKQPT